MKLALPIFFALIVSISAFGQNEQGIYLTVQCAKKSPKQKVLISDKFVCLAAHPMILLSDFEVVSEVQQAGDKLWFDVTISDKAIQTLVRISQNLPNSTFAFVADKDNVFSTFEAKDLVVGKTFRFEGTGKHKSMFEDTQKKLKDAMQRVSTPQ